jgi:hypothetical protein
LFSYDISLAADFPAPFSFFLAPMAQNCVLSRSLHIRFGRDFTLKNRYITGDAPDSHIQRTAYLAKIKYKIKGFIGNLKEFLSHFTYSIQIKFTK